MTFQQTQNRQCDIVFADEQGFVHQFCGADGEGVFADLRILNPSASVVRLFKPAPAGLQPGRR